VTSVVLDSGAFLAIERDDRDVVAMIKAAHQMSWTLRSNGGVVAEIWRGGEGRQVKVARLLKAVQLIAVDDELGRSAGLLLRDAKGSNAVDATVVALAEPGDQVLTSDPTDIERLVAHWGRDINVIAC